MDKSDEWEISLSWKKKKWARDGEEFYLKESQKQKNKDSEKYSMWEQQTSVSEWNAVWHEERDREVGRGKKICSNSLWMC